ncbi:hypothetical protein EAF00_008447 [Botryotinia globosa]|nr:hypothetical protein EAF00_008447 [Botryotinia globosa]
MYFTLLLCIAILIPSCLPSATPSQVSSNNKRASTSTCLNAASSRNCWNGNYSIDTDSEEAWPNTGVVVTTMSPDGTPRWMLVVSGTYPGPYHYCNVSIHYHGIVQTNTNTMDGVNGITECPIPPGSSTVYKFLATQHGTSWYHSHHAAQYGDGVLGSISTCEEGLFSVSKGPPKADNGLINGTNRNRHKTAGVYNQVWGLVPGAEYRLQIINTSVDNHFQVTLDSHSFQVVQTDFVPIQSYTTNTIFIAIGQRYDVIITADQTPSNYWFRAIVPKPPTQKGFGCGQNANNGSINAIFSYQGVESSEPDPKSFLIPQSCEDETQLVSWYEKSVPENEFSILELPYANAWTFWIIKNAAAIPHPIHLHGHDFCILGQENGVNFTDKSSLNFANPARRDVAMLPALGYLVIAFVTDNPGAWLLHCHITFHVGEGLALQFLEQESEIAQRVDLSTVDAGCKRWDTWYSTERVDNAWNTEFDSGI